MCMFASINDSKLHLVRRKTQRVEQMENWRMNRLPPLLYTSFSFTLSLHLSARDKFASSKIWLNTKNHKIYTYEVHNRRQCLCNYSFEPNINRCAFGKWLSYDTTSLIHTIFSRMYQYNGTVYFTWFLRMENKRKDRNNPQSLLGIKKKVRSETKETARKWDTISLYSDINHLQLNRHWEQRWKKATLKIK